MAVANGSLPHGEALPPSESLRAWACGRLPLGRSTSAAVLEAPNWAALYLALFTDDRFRLEVGLADVFSSSDLEALHDMSVRPAHYSRRGLIDDVLATSVRGWALNPEQLGQRAPVELWIDHDFVAAVVPGLFRRDLQDRYGGDGCVGFSIAVPPAFAGRSALFQLRDGGGGRLLDQRHVVVPARHSGVLESVRKDIADLRLAIEKLERSLPAAVYHESFDLGDYSQYQRLYEGAGLSPGGGGSLLPHVLVILDCTEAPFHLLEDAIWSLVRQGHPSWELCIVGLADQDLVRLKDLDTRVFWTTKKWLPPSAAGLTAADPELALLACPDQSAVLLLSGEGSLVPGGLSCLIEALEGEGVVAAFPDEDHIDSGCAERGGPGEVWPILKPDFDWDLLQQTPYVGRCVAFRAGALKRRGLRVEAAPWMAADVLLRSLPEDGAVAHVSRILHRRRGRSWDPGASWQACVTRALEGVASVEPLHDLLGVSVPGGLRIKRSCERVTASIIIPSKNRRDLLEPCVESILKRRSSNMVDHEVCLVDHDSDEQSSLDYLGAIGSVDGVSVKKYSGDFNWALINNISSADSKADVLVFLNNDTIVLSDGWVDALCAEAIRPDVGVVGARLLYGDGTIQHAGFVGREGRQDFLVHEGVGVAGSDGGYMGRHALTHACIAVTGACMAIERSKFEMLGGFESTSFPIEYNDVDLCFKSWSAGLKVLYVPGATLYHLESSSRGFNVSEEKRIRSAAATSRMWEKWGRQFERDPWFNVHFDRQGRPFERLRPPRE